MQNRPTHAQREEWIDIVKLFSCIGVAMVHLSQSLTKADLASNQSFFYIYLNTSLAHLRVPVFFFCSGFLYQVTSYSKPTTSYADGLIKKAVNLLTPYIAFSLITIWLKKKFESSINSQNEFDIIETLVSHPVSPYWFLYSLFVLFLIPIPKNTRQYIAMLLIAILGKALIITDISSNIYALSALQSHSIWFFLGIGSSRYNWHKRLSKYWPTTLIYFPITLFLLPSTTNKITVLPLTVLGITMCVAIAFSYFRKKTPSKTLLFLKKHTLHIFLLHTLCAAPIRIILLKLEVRMFSIHLITGIASSILFPVIIGIISEKNHFLSIPFTPYKSLKLLYYKYKFNNSYPQMHNSR